MSLEITEEEISSNFETLTALTKELKQAAASLTPKSAKKLVNLYYRFQQQRIRFDNQLRADEEQDDPLLSWFSGQMTIPEKNTQKALDIYSKNHPVGMWMRSICGIGPVLASGFLAHIDIYRAPTVGHIYSHAGVVPGVKWEKGQKRPWNADLKRLLFLAGECFVKVQNRPKDVYGKIYAERKALEQEANRLGMFADQAAAILREKKFDKTTDAYAAYSQGFLPDAHIHARARRFAAKIWLSHLHEVWHEIEFGLKPVFPYVLTHLGHVHYRRPPNWPMGDEDVEEAHCAVEILPETLAFDIWEEEEIDDDESFDEADGNRPVRLLSSPPQVSSLSEKLAYFKSRVESRHATKKTLEYPMCAATIWGRPRMCKVIGRDAGGLLRVLVIQQWGDDPTGQIETRIPLESVVPGYRVRIQDYLSTLTDERATRLFVTPRMPAPGDHRGLRARIEEWKSLR